MGIYEFSLKTKVTYEQVARTLSIFRKISLSEIGEEFDFYDKIQAPDKLKFGLEISLNDKGYETFLKVYSIEDLLDKDFANLALALAKECNTEVGIADLTKTSEYEGNCYVIIFATDEYQRAFDITVDSDNFELKPYEEKNKFEDFIQSL
jgi:hypothetical protein